MGSLLIRMSDVSLSLFNFSFNVYCIYLFILSLSVYPLIIVFYRRNIYVYANIVPDYKSSTQTPPFQASQRRSRAECSEHPLAIYSEKKDSKRHQTDNEDDTLGFKEDSRLYSRPFVYDRPFLVHVSVKDEGVGISAKDHERIFNMFEQVHSAETQKSPGTGLGLNITRKLCELMEGDVSVRSSLGKGSTFTAMMVLEWEKAEEKNDNPLAQSTIKEHIAQRPV